MLLSSIDEYVSSEHIVRFIDAFVDKVLNAYPQLYLVDMKTKQVIWDSCGWYEGFTKDIEKIIKDNE